MILRLHDVSRVTGLSRATIYRLISQGKFPSQVNLTSRLVGWHDAEIQSWLKTLTSKANVD